MNQIVRCLTGCILALAFLDLLGPRFSFCFVSSAQAASLSASKLSKASRLSKVKIINFREGDTLTTTSLFFDDVNKLIRITGRFSKVTTLVNNADFKIIVSGTDIATLPGTSINFRRPSGVGRYMTIGFRAELPAPLPDPQFPMLDVTVELVYKKTDQVLVRDLLSLYDLRNRQATAGADPTQPGVNLTSQLSNPGLGEGTSQAIEGLELPVFSQAPYPNLADFNGRLEAAAIQSAVQEASGLAQKHDICIPLDELEEERFRIPAAFPAYFEALAEANVLYQAYQAAQQGAQACNAAFPGLGAALCQLIVDGAACVQNPPQAQDFELCIDRIIGKPSSLSVGELSDLELSFVNSASTTQGRMESQIEFLDYNGLIDGRLQDFVVRWRGSACSKLLRPSAQLDNAKTIELAWLNEWSLCRDMQLDSGVATTKSRPQDAPQYNVNQDPTNKNRLYVSDARLAEFQLLNLTSNHLKGSCGIEQIAPGAEDYIRLFREQLSVILSDVWNDAAPNSRMAQLLDLLLRPFAIGEVLLPGYTINARVNSIRSSSQAGLLVDWSTLVSPTESESFNRLKQAMFAVSEGPAIQSVDALDLQNRSFDISYGIAINFLNRILWARAAGSELHSPLILEIVQGGSGFGGLPSPGGLPGGGFGGGTPVPVSTSVFSGDFLATIHPAFQELIGKDYEIVVERVLDPLVYMPEDPSAFIPQVGAPISYGIRSLKLNLKEVDKLKDGKVAKVGKSIIEFDASFADEDFSLSLDSELGSQLLESNVADADWHLNVKKSSLRRCPMFSHQSSVNQTNACERELENEFTLLVRDRLAGIFADLLDHVPAPQFFDTEGLALESVQSNEQSKAQFDGQVTLFGQFQ